jgi:integrase
MVSKLDILSNKSLAIYNTNPDIAEYTNYMIRRNSRRNTINRHISRIRYIKRMLGVQDLLEVRAREQIAELIDKHLMDMSNITRNSYHSTIKTFFYDFWLDKFKGNPMPIISQKDSYLVHTKTSQRIQVFTEKHLKIFKEVCEMNLQGNPPLPESDGKHFRGNGNLVGTFFQTQLDVGMRIGEVIWSNLDSIREVETKEGDKSYFFWVHNYLINGKTISNYNRIEGRTIKTNGYIIKYSEKRDKLEEYRKPPISKHTYDILIEYIQKHRPTPCDSKLQNLIFLDNRRILSSGRKPTEKDTSNLGGILSVQRMDELFSDLMDECEFVARKKGYDSLKFNEFRPHDLRATFATIHLLNNVPAPVVAAWMGDTLQAISIYARFIEDELRRKNYQSVIDQ